MPNIALSRTVTRFRLDGDESPSLYAKMATNKSWIISVLRLIIKCGRVDITMKVFSVKKTYGNTKTC